MELFNVYGMDLYYSDQELMQIEARRTKIEMLKREMGDKYLLAPVYPKLEKPIK
jgi:hypothetical protein